MQIIATCSWVASDYSRNAIESRSQRALLVYRQFLRFDSVKGIRILVDRGVYGLFASRGFYRRNFEREQWKCFFYTIASTSRNIKNILRTLLVIFNSRIFRPIQKLIWQSWGWLIFSEGYAFIRFMWSNYYPLHNEYILIIINFYFLEMYNFTVYFISAYLCNEVFCGIVYLIIRSRFIKIWQR